MDAGELKVILGADISGLRQSLNDGNSLLNDISNSMRDVKGVVNSGVVDIGQSITNLSGVVNSLSISFGGVTGEVSSSMQSISSSASQMSGSLKASMTEANTSLDTIGATLEGISGRITGQTSAITRNFNMMSTGISTGISSLREGMTGGFTGITGALERFDASFRGVATDVKMSSEAVVNSINNIGNAIIGTSEKSGNLTRISNQLTAVVRKMSEFQNSMTGDAFGGTAIGKNMTSMLEAVTNGFSKLESQAGRTGKTMKDSFNGVGGTLGTVRTGLVATAMTMRQLALDVFILRMNVQFVGNALWGVVHSGMEFGAQMETAQLGIAGILTSMTTLNGEAMAFPNAMGISAGLMEQIKDNALLTSVTTGELLHTFQALLAPGLSAKMTLEQIVDIATVGSNAVNAIGLKGGQVVQEMRDLMMGGIRPQSSTLAASLGINDSMVKQWREAGTLYTELKTRMAGFDEAAKLTQDSFSGIWSNIKDGLERSQSQGFAPFFGYVKKGLKEVQEIFYTVKEKKVGERVNKDTGEKEDVTAPYAVMNKSTQEFFGGVAQVGVRLLALMKNIFSNLAPLVQPFIRVLSALSGLLVQITTILMPLGQAFSYVFGEVVNLVSNGMELLVENVGVLSGILAILTGRLLFQASAWAITTLATTANAIALGWNTGTMAVNTAGIITRTLASWAAVAGTIAHTIATHNLALAYEILAGAMSIANIAMVGLIVVVAGFIAVALAVKYSWNNVGELFIGVTEYMSTGWQIFCNNMTKGFKEAMIIMVGMLRVFAGAIDLIPGVHVGAGLAGTTAELSSSIGEINAQTDALVIKQEEAQQKINHGWQRFSLKQMGTDIVSGITQDYTNLVKKFTKPDGDIEGKPTDSTSKNKGAGKLANAQEKLDIAEIEALRKAYVEDIKKYIKERDIAYEQGEISQRQHIEFVYEAEKQIALIEYQALDDKLAVQKGKEEEARDRGDEAGALKAEADAVKTLSEMRSKEVEILTKTLEYKNNLIKADKETLKTLYSTIVAYKDLVGGASDYQNALAGITYEDSLKKINSMISDYTSLLAPLNSLTDAEKKHYTEELRLANLAKTDLTGKKKYDDATNAVNDYEKEYKRVMAGIEATEAENKLAVSQGKMTEVSAQEASIKLRKEANVQLQVTVDKLDAIMNSTSEPTIINKIRTLVAEIKGVGTELSLVAKQMKTTLEDGFTDAFASILSGSKSVSSAFKAMATSILNDMSKLLSKKFSQQLVGGINLEGMFGGGKKNGNDNSIIKVGNSSKLVSAEMNKLASSLTQVVTLDDKGNIVTKTANELTNLGNTKNITLQSSLDSLTISAKTAAEALNAVGGSSLSTSFGGSGSIDVLETVLNSKADGGYIQGAGTGTSDSIPSLLSNGEYVMPAAIVKKFGRNLFETLRGGSLPKARFATGGIVSSSSSASSDSDTSSNSPTPNVAINLINGTGTQLTATKGETKFDGKSWVVQMFLSGVSSNTAGLKDMLRGLK